MNPSYTRVNLPFQLFEVHLGDIAEDDLLQVSRDLGIGLSLQEMKACQRYFSKSRRNPTDIELQTIGQTWSEHCFH